MGRKDGEGGPLDWLAQAVGCAYLSDLKQPEYRQALARVIRDAPEDRWTVKSWQDAGAYLTGAPCGVHSEREARDYLDHWLRATP